jgi:hypothetical protein
VRGATCWMDVLSYMGTTYSTFKDTCGARGMLADDAVGGVPVSASAGVLVAPALPTRARASNGS